MNMWCEQVMAEYPHFNMVGEEWTVEPAIVSYWQKGQSNLDGYHCALPSLMDFPMQEAIVHTVNGDDSKAYHTLAMDFLYPKPDNLVVFLDNHDMSRVFTQVNEDMMAYKKALAYLTIMRGIPQVYYGTEILMKNPGTWEHGIIRSDFPGGWAGDSINAFTQEGLTAVQKEAQAYVKQLMTWRQNKSVIHFGKTMQFAPLYDEKVYTLARYNDDDLVMLLMSNSDKEITMSTDRFVELTHGITVLKNVLTEEGVDISAGSITIPAKGFLLLEK